MATGRTPTLIICLAGAAVAVAALVLPGSDDAEPAPPTARDAASPAVEIIDFAFSGPESVAAGATIELSLQDARKELVEAALARLADTEERRGVPRSAADAARQPRP